ncbi:Na+/H+ antiporter [Rhodococcus spelaei]|uniref:Na+/H+ antiporter n=1 Tax=Rhodococcus spelaei TaxID=2546320 RepID=A0A541BP84_9NOCA|nr:Na+/H+ antiporter [Rhodococcus spelaei]TQF74141.1 Na+/H+ antiporter [Rhodococcus spelaei]
MNFTWLLFVVIAGVALTGLAKRLGFQVPLVLVTIGAAASFIPGIPRLEMPPDLMLGVVLPPLLYSAALDFSFSTFRRNLAPILRLGIGMVVVTTVAVGFFANWLVPEFTLGAAFVLGAVVAPPDAVAAVSVGRRLGLPARMMAILKGESLVNDAAALTLFALSVAAVTGKKIAIDSPILFFLYEIVGGVLVGLVLSGLVRLVRARIVDSPMETVLGLVLPFAAYLAAEEIHASGVLAVVTAGFVLGRTVGDESVDTRIQERAVWPTVDLLLETFVFAYMGLQLKFVIDDVRADGLPVHHVFGYGLAVLALVIVVRPAWIFVNRGRRKVTRSIVSLPTSDARLNWRQNLVISWAGMRGVVTLAAASGVPLTTLAGDPFPGRGVIQAIAFTVAVGTLLIQGATLPTLIRLLDVADPDEEQRTAQQTTLARQVSRSAADAALLEVLRDPPPGVGTEELVELAERVRRTAEARIAAEQEEYLGEHDAKLRDAGALFNALRTRVLKAQRGALIAARDAGELDDEVLRRVLESLDMEEAAAEARVQRQRW